MTSHDILYYNSCYDMMIHIYIYIYIYIHVMYAHYRCICICVYIYIYIHLLSAVSCACWQRLIQVCHIARTARVPLRCGLPRRPPMSPSEITAGVWCCRCGRDGASKAARSGIAATGIDIVDITVVSRGGGVSIPFVPNPARRDLCPTTCQGRVRARARPQTFATRGRGAAGGAGSSLYVCVCIYVYIYIYIHVCYVYIYIYTYIHIYIERDVYIYI